MLNRIIRMLEEENVSSVSELSEALEVSPEMLLTMLEDLERMGFLRKLNTTNCAGSCPGCTRGGGTTIKNRVWELTEKIREKR